MTRLDEMDFNQISLKYEDMFDNLIEKDTFQKIKNDIEAIYNEYIYKIEKEKFKVKGGTFGRGELKWGRNIIWGWYIEALVKELFSKNKNIKKIEYLGGDSSHSFLFDDVKKRIEIIGQKSVSPDFLITLMDGRTFTIELKTAAVEVFSIKKGNIEQLYKETAYNNRINLILMIDLQNKLFSIENLLYFNVLTPFVNQRMEGQLCYNFPPPERNLAEIMELDFNEYLDESIFEIDMIKKLKALKKAEDTKNKRLINIIKNKIKIEKLEDTLELQTNTIYDQIENIQSKYPDIITSWDDIYKELKIK
jgi:hypothetical protein